MIIDAHTHIFDEMRGINAAGPVRGIGFGRVRVGDGAAARDLPFLPPLNERTCHTADMLIQQLDQAGVDKAVLLQGPWYGDQNDAVRAALARHPNRLAGAAYFDPWLPDARSTFDREIACDSAFRCVKLEFSASFGLCSFHPDARIDDGAVQWLWPALEQLGLVLTLDLGAIGSVSYQTEAVRHIAERHPRLKIVIAHLGQVTRAAEHDPAHWRQWHAQLALGRLPNVWFDTSSLPGAMYDEGHPYPSVERYVQIAAGQIGADKLMWGTDIPGLYRVGTYPQLLELGRRHTSFLSPRDQARVLGETALAVYFVHTVNATSSM
jgi:predicted TIM-barrel fold metal-dependent hydrolase